MYSINKKDILDYLLTIATARHISQRKLIEDIYDYSHFNKMCNGKEEISLDVIVACCEKLQIPFETVVKQCKLKDTKSFESILSKFEYIKLTQQHEQLEELLLSISDFKEGNIKSQQIYYMIKATIEAELNKNYLFAFDLYVKALQCSNSEFYLEQYSIDSMGINEIGILYNIALEYNRMEKKEESRLILENIVNWFKCIKVDSIILYKACYELSDIYIHLKDYKRATILLKWGIEFGKHTGNYIGFGYLYYNLSIANSYLDQVEESLDNFNQSIAIFKIQDRPETYIEKLRKDYEMERKH